MRRRTKVLIAGGLLATAAIVPAIAQAGAGADATVAPAVAPAEVDSDSRVVPSVAPTGVDSDSTVVPAKAPGEAESDSPADSVSPVTGPDIARASEVAIAYMGGGTVTDTEIGDEESYYEVEVALDGGRQVDVQVDENFNVVGGAEDGTEAEGSSEG